MVAIKITKRELLLFVLVFWLTGQNTLFAQTVKQSYLYGVKGADSLWLDRYYASGEQKACVVFVFGGGFYTGQRDAQQYRPYFDHLVGCGYTVVSIDYRLGFKRMAEEAKNGTFQPKNVSPRGLIDRFEQTINMAVEDLYSATEFILANSASWGVDPNTIIVSGSSAGAITALTAEYYLANRDRYEELVPFSEDFRYAGVLSYAGAVFSRSKMKWDRTPAPIALFHGNADSNVPYGKIWTPIASFNGSKTIAKQLTRIKAPHLFYSIEDATHAVAITPITENIGVITDFIEQVILAKQKLVIDTKVRQLDAPKRKHHFGIRDYVKSNFVR